MKKMFVTSVLLAMTLLSAGCDDMAHWAYDKAVSLEKARAGLNDNTVSTADGIEWHVLVSDHDADKTAVLLLHGFGADSSNWVRFANELEGDFYFVIPDLPGHGESTARTDMDYQMATQGKRLLALMDSMNIERFHVAGNSMGGAISLALADKAPQRVLSMGLIDSAGLTRQTPAFKAISEESEQNPLIPRNASDFHTTLDWAMEKPPYMPDFFINVMGEKKAAKASVADKVWQDLQTDPYMSLEDSDRLATLNVPALLLWGSEDRLLGLDNVTAFEAQLPQTTTVILDGIGHVPMAEAPGQSAQALKAFWRDIEQGN